MTSKFLIFQLWLFQLIVFFNVKIYDFIGIVFGWKSGQYFEWFLCTGWRRFLNGGSFRFHRWFCDSWHGSWWYPVIFSSQLSGNSRAFAWSLVFFCSPLLFVRWNSWHRGVTWSFMSVYVYWGQCRFWVFIFMRIFHWVCFWDRSLVWSSLL